MVDAADLKSVVRKDVPVQVRLGPPIKIFLMTVSTAIPLTDLIVQKATEYLSVPSVVGHEGWFLNTLFDEYTEMGLEAVRHEGLLEVRGKNPNSAILCAHIDRHGLISIGEGEYVYAAQYMKEIKYGQNNRASQKEIETITRRFEGERVYAYDPLTGKHLGAGLIQTVAPWKLRGDVMFEVSGLEDVELGYPIAYARTARTENGYLKGQLDNVISLAVIYALYKNGFSGTALLACEEEIGKSWVHLSAWLEKENIETKNLMVIDTSPYADPAPVDDGLVIFRNRDMSAAFNPAIVSQMKNRANDLGLPYHFKDEVLLARGKRTEQLGSTELGKLIMHSQGLWSGATVQIPTIMYHTSNETTSLKAIDNYFSFLSSILIEKPLELSALRKSA